MAQGPPGKPGKPKLREMQERGCGAQQAPEARIPLALA